MTGRIVHDTRIISFRSFKYKVFYRAMFDKSTSTDGEKVQIQKVSSLQDIIKLTLCYSYLDCAPSCVYVPGSNLEHCTSLASVADYELELYRTLRENQVLDSGQRQTDSQSLHSQTVFCRSKPTFYQHTLCLEDYLDEGFQFSLVSS